jgi:predicted short-subunit dehydrogenase-like oxidoreductase (DUF2520 family)
MRTVSIIGVGRAGGALALALAKKEYRIENLVSRDPDKAERIADAIEPRPNVLPEDDFSGISSEIIFITTQDTEVRPVSKALAPEAAHGPFVFHTSGSLSSEVLSDLKEAGCETGSIHPLVSISDARMGSERFGGVYFCVEGTPKAVDLAKNIVAELGGKSFTIETPRKALYHAAAVMSAGHVTALIDAAFETMAKCGLDPGTVKNVLLPLIKSTVENLETLTPASALTGTFARADAETFEAHMAAFKDTVTPEIIEIYLQLAARSLDLAERNGVDTERVGRLRNKVLMAKKDIR